MAPDSRRDLFGSCIVADICLHNQDNINNYEIVPEEAQYCMVLVLQQYGPVLVNSCNLDFLHFKIFNF